MSKPTINAHLDHSSPFCESCPCCLWNQIEQVAKQRDEYHEWADRLAEAIAAHFREEIGEHSSANNPWARAFELIDSTWCR